MGQELDGVRGFLKEDAGQGIFRSIFSETDISSYRGAYVARSFHIEEGKN